MMRSRLAQATVTADMASGAHPGDPFHADVGDEPGRGIVDGREADHGAKADVSESLEKFGGASIGDAGSPVDDEVFGQAHGLAGVSLDGQSGAAVVANVAYLAVLGKVGHHDLIAVQADTDDAHLRTAVGVQGHQVRRGGGLAPHVEPDPCTQI